MRLNIALAIFALTFATIATADDQYPQFSLSTWWKSSYVAALGVKVHKDPVLQAWLDIAITRNWYGQLWWSNGLDTHPGTDFGDEVDFTIGWTRKNSDGLAIDASLAYFDFAPVFDKGAADLVVLSLDIGQDIAESADKRNSLAVFGKVERYWSTNEAYFTDGTLSRMGLRASRKASPRLSLSSQLYLLHNDGLTGTRPGNLVGGNILFDLQLSKEGDWIFHTGAWKADPNRMTGLDSSTVLGAGVTHKF